MAVKSEKYLLLPEFHLTTPGLPLHPPIIAENIQIYYRSPPRLPSDSSFFHNKFILIFCFEGKRQVKVNNEIYEIHKNEVLIIPALSRHYFPGNDDGYEMIMIGFTLASANRSVELICSRLLQVRAGFAKKLDRCIDSFLEWFDNGPGAASECCYRVSSLLNDLVVRHGGVAVENQTYINHEQKLLKSALDIITLNLDVYLSIKELAGRLNISASHLRFIFRKYMKGSLGSYIRARHMNRAQQLLRSSDLTLGEIAQQVGYQSESGLIRGYKRETGHTPSVARKIDREKKMRKF